MLNDKDPKNEGQEESEYHFSEDEEISYEVEPEAKPSAAEGGSKLSLINRLAQSKRMLISGAAFLLLIFVVYKMITPTSTAPSTDITAVATTGRSAMPTQPPAEVPSKAPAQAPQMPVQATQQMPQVAPETSPQVAQVPQASQPSVAPGLTPAPVVASQPPAAVSSPTSGAPLQPSPTVGAQVVPPQSPVVSQTASEPLTVSPTELTPQVSAQPQASFVPSGSVQSTAQQPQQAAQNAEASPQPVGMPSVIPVQSPIPTTVAMQSGTFSNQLPPSDEAKLASLQANSERLMTQMQADYAQKLSEYAAQNKALQDQMQTLNSRVAGMESQMAQLLQALTRQTQAPAPVSPPSLQQTVPDQKISYNVQAIIPGRAWLKSDNGETLTVAEGDVVRDVGRITKIDPYDGVVEINTGNKVISLSYGNGG